MSKIINWRFFRHAGQEWWKLLRENWKKEGLWAVLTFFFTTSITAILRGIPTMITGIEAAGIGLLGAIFTYVIRFLWIAVNAPFAIISNQDKLIEKYSKKVNTEEIIISLRTQRRIGTEIRNEGQRLIHNDSVEIWEKKLADWKDVTANIIASLDRDKAEEWKTLSNYLPKMQLNNPLSAKHNALYAQFSERLERLNNVTDYLKEKYQ